MTVKINGKDVLTSGSVVVAKGCIPSVEILTGFMISFEFIEDADHKPDIRGAVENDALALKLININNSLGMSYKNTIGKSDGRTIEMALYVHAVGDEGRVHLLNYTFWVGEEVQ